jgi:hypothetical protein
MKTLTTFEAPDMNKTTWMYNHRHSSELWDIAAEILTELSKRDEVEYKVKATSKSVEEKIRNL